MDTCIIAIPEFMTTSCDEWIGQLGPCPYINTLDRYNPVHPQPTQSYGLKYIYRGVYPMTKEGYRFANLYIRYLAQSRRWSKWEMVVEFSVTNLLLGNNLMELPPKNPSENLAASLTELLRKVGIRVNITAESLLFWCRADFSRNFALSHCTTGEIIIPLMVLSPGVHYQTVYEDYAGDGFRLAAYNKQRYSVIYDKIAEVVSYPTRHPEMEKSSALFLLARELRGDTSQVLRVECRLNSAEAVKRELSPLLGHQQPYSFTEMVDWHTGKFVITRYLERLAGRNRLKLLLLMETHTEKELTRMLKSAARATNHRFNGNWLVYLKLIVEFGEKEASAIMRKLVSADTVRNYRQSLAEAAEVIPLDNPIWSDYSAILENIAFYRGR